MTFIDDEDEREKALDEMHRATVELLKLIEAEKKCYGGAPSWDAIEVALLDIREAWEDAWPVI